MEFASAWVPPEQPGLASPWAPLRVSRRARGFGSLRGRLPTAQGRPAAEGCGVTIGKAWQCLTLKLRSRGSGRAGSAQFTNSHIHLVSYARPVIPCPTDGLAVGVGPSWPWEWVCGAVSGVSKSPSVVANTATALAKARRQLPKRDHNEMAHHLVGNGPGVKRPAPVRMMNTRHRQNSTQ